MARALVRPGSAGLRGGREGLFCYAIGTLKDQKQVLAKSTACRLRIGAGMGEDGVTLPTRLVGCSAPGAEQGQREKQRT